MLSAIGPNANITRKHFLYRRFAVIRLPDSKNIGFQISVNECPFKSGHILTNILINSSKADELELVRLHPLGSTGAHKILAAKQTGHSEHLGVDTRNGS